MNKEHLETNLTIKASDKEGHIFTVDTLSNCPICRHQEVEYMGEIDQESKTADNVNVLMALL